MAKDDDSLSKYAPAIIIAFILLFTFIYLLQVYPGERAMALSGNPSGNTIEIINGAFVPNEIKIHKGASITWINRDRIDHQIIGMDFQSGILKPGGMFTQKFNEVGTYVYNCNIHQNEYGKIIVS